MQSSNSIYSLYCIITRLRVEASYSSTYYHLRLWARNMAIVFFSEMSGAVRVGECVERQVQTRNTCNV
jgi:hypothetical protein